MKLVIATHNRDKVLEFQRILQPLAIEVITADLPEVEENGKTFAENAYLKAISAFRAMGKAAVADDSGLEVDALNGAPGIYSARYAGENATNEQRIAKLLDSLKDVPAEKRTARFVCSICCILPNGDIVTARGECPGKIAFEIRGQGGFGYDPVFLVGEKTFGELNAEEKDQISHRGKALRIFADELRKYKENSHAEQ